MTSRRPTDEADEAGHHRDPSVWRNGLATARAALHAAEASPPPAGRSPDDHAVRSSEGVVVRARRIAAWVNGVGDPDQLERRQ